MKSKIFNIIDKAGFKAFCLLTAVIISFASCDSYLDRLPDDRAEMNSSEKVTNLLVGAYSTGSVILINELSSDNVTDNGKAYSTTTLMDELYRFKEVTDEGNDSPRSIWNNFYEAVSTANIALEAIENLGNPKELAAEKAEALLCRAYSMFTLSTVFCMAYDPTKANEYLGLPYPKASGLSMTERGTLRELYENINQDIEEALPYITDNYSVPKYHFNVKAAYAFAARFNLYYMKYDKVVEYANKVLGAYPVSMMRDFTKLQQFGAQDIQTKFINSSENCNLLLIPSYSVVGVYCGLYSSSNRFRHNQTMASYETYWAAMPWGSGSSSNTLYYSHMLYGTNQLVYFPSVEVLFEYTDKVNGIGYYHTVTPVFTAEETLLCRAEAYAMLGDNQKCIEDLNTWVYTHCEEEHDGAIRPTLTVDKVNSFMENLDYAPIVPEGSRDRSIRKTFNPQGFTVASGTQENLLQFVLHMRRLETISLGLRFQDCKRYGIEFAHILGGEDAQVFTAGDLRGAIQLPNDVIAAGMQPNPRAQVESPAEHPAE